MGSVNKAMIVGNIGKDAEIRYTSGGTPVTTISVATTEKFTDREGQKREDTQWHRVVIWGKTAESLHEYLTKGKQIYVEGKIQTREWEKDGVKQRTTEIRSDRIVLLGGGSGGSGSGSCRGGHVRDEDIAHEPATGVDPAEDDIPF